LFSLKIVFSGDILLALCRKIERSLDKRKNMIYYFSLLIIICGSCPSSLTSHIMHTLNCMTLSPLQTNRRKGRKKEGRENKRREEKKENSQGTDSKIRHETNCGRKTSGGGIALKIHRTISKINTVCQSR
jgi:hypothetical protein